MERWKNRVAVVTGASSGIGATCAKLLVAAGIQVVGLARRTDRLVALKHSMTTKQQSQFHHRTCDVCREDQVQEAFDWVEQQFGGTDILVNNAGILRDGNLVEMPLQTINDVVMTNFMAPINCSRQAFRSMQKRNFAGHLITINSTAGLPGFNPGPVDPSLNIYTPTKYALNAVSEILRQEFITLKTKIKTTNISPGWVSTEIMSDELKTALGEVVLQPEDVAGAVIYALSTPPNAQVQEITLRAVGEWH